MPQSSTDIFDQLLAAADEGDADRALAGLADQLLSQKDYHRLFNVRQMQVRHGLGLSVIDTGDLDSMTAEHRRKLEDGYVDACREVGKLLLAEGNIRDAWTYLQISGDREDVRAALADAQVDEENATELIEVALYEHVAPQLGFELVLDNFGTCNAITTLEAELPGLPRDAQLACAGRLVRHLHGELLENVRSDIAQREDTEAEQATIAELISGRDDLLADQNYHVDTSHLASVMRFARMLEDSESIRLAIDLAAYGQKLDPQYQYPGEEPFVELYPAEGLFLHALLGEQVDEALSYFRGRAEGLDIEEDGSLAAEVYIYLLDRLERFNEAIDETVRLIPADVHTTGFAPGLLELSKRSGSYEKLMQICRERDDPLGFAAGLVESRSGGGSFGVRECGGTGVRESVRV